MGRLIPTLSKMPAAAYHADPCPRPSLSASIASTLLKQSPYHAWLRHPRLGGVARQPTEELDRGSIIHALVLRSGEEQIAALAFDNYRTKAAQEARDAARAGGKIPVLARDLDDCAAVAGSIRARLSLEGIALEGQSEMAAVWEEETNEGPVLCRGMLDHVALRAHAGLILDLKTCRSAHPRACESYVIEYGYDLQRAAYVSAVEKVRPDLAGLVDYLWLFVEELTANARQRVVLTVARASGSLREHGERRWRRACRVWARCLRTGDWPGYAVGTVELDAPAWALAEEL